MVMPTIASMATVFADREILLNKLVFSGHRISATCTMQSFKNCPSVNGFPALAINSLPSFLLGFMENVYLIC